MSGAGADRYLSGSGRLLDLGSFKVLLDCNMHDLTRGSEKLQRHRCTGRRSPPPPYILTVVYFLNTCTE